MCIICTYICAVDHIFSTVTAMHSDCNHVAVQVHYFILWHCNVTRLVVTIRGR